MPFTRKTWVDRLVEFAGRRKLTDVTTQTVQTVDVARDEGNVSQEGTAFSAANMNDLEQRIADCVSAMETTFQDGVNTLYNQCVSCGVTPAAKTPTAIASAIMTIYTNRYNAGVNATKVGTATAAQVLTGYTFTNRSSVGASGSMPNRGTLNFNPSGSASQSVPAGYYSGGTLSSANAYNAGYNEGQANAQPAQKGYQGIIRSESKSSSFTATKAGYTLVVGIGGRQYDGSVSELSLTVKKNNVNQTVIRAGNYQDSEYSGGSWDIKYSIFKVDNGDSISATVGSTNQIWGGMILFQI